MDTPPAPRKNFSRTAKVGLGVVLVFAFVNTVRTRTLGDFLQYTAVVYFSVAVFVGATFLIDRSPSTRSRREQLSEVGTFLLGLALISPVFYSAGALLKDLYVWIQSPSLSRTQAVAAGAVITAALGSALFYFRLRLRSVYGASEALVGVLVATHRIATESDAAVKEPAFYLAILTAGVYLVVRGLDNMHQGLVKEPLDPIFTWLLKRLNRNA